MQAAPRPSQNQLLSVTGQQSGHQLAQQHPITSRGYAVSGVVARGPSPGPKVGPAALRDPLFCQGCRLLLLLVVLPRLLAHPVTIMVQLEPTPASPLALASSLPHSPHTPYSLPLAIGLRVMCALCHLHVGHCGHLPTVVVIENVIPPGVLVLVDWGIPGAEVKAMLGQVHGFDSGGGEQVTLCLGGLIVGSGLGLVPIASLGWRVPAPECLGAMPNLHAQHPSLNVIGDTVAVLAPHAAVYLLLQLGYLCLLLSSHLFLQLFLPASDAVKMQVLFPQVLDLLLQPGDILGGDPAIIWGCLLQRQQLLLLWRWGSGGELGGSPP